MSQVERSAGELARHRTAVDVATEAYRALLRDGEKSDWPSDPDEPWSIKGGALTLLSDGPIQPVADRDAERRVLEEQQRRQEDEKIHWIRQARSSAEVGRRLAEALGVVGPERIHRIQAAADEHLAFVKAEAARQTEEREKRKRAIARLGEERSRSPASVA